MEPMAGVDVAILGAVPQEIRALSELLETCRVFSSRGQTIWVGKLAHLSVLMGTTGLGKVNAAITTASLLERFAVAQVWNVGCAGAYPEGPLRVGDVLVTKVALCGDEGVITQEGVQSVSEIGIPLVVDKGVAFFDRFPSHWDENLEAIITRTLPGYYRQASGPRPERAVLHAAEDGTGFRRSDTQDHPIGELKAPLGPSPAAGEAEADLFRLVQGPSLTVGMASGDPQVARERFRRYGTYAENLEGSAVAQTCLRFQVPMVECRGMSNVAGIRAKETWQMEKSVAHCHGIVINWIETLQSLIVNR